MHFVGVNGCKRGWLAVALQRDAAWTHLAARDFAEIGRRYGDALILVDVPIGLRDAGTAERLCDIEARKVLGPRASSVFPALCRSALSQQTYEAASAENQRKTGRKLSTQSWAIVPRIADVERYMAEHSATGPIVREIHPEVCFWGLAGRPMTHAKHTDEGLAERVQVLKTHFHDTDLLLRDLTDRYPSTVLSPDDVLDALVGAVTGLVGADHLQTLPAEPEVDSHNLRMEIVYARPRQ